MCIRQAGIYNNRPTRCVTLRGSAVTAWPALLRVTLALPILGDDAAVAYCPAHGGLGDMRGSDAAGLTYWQCGEVADCAGRQSAVWALYDALGGLAVDSGLR